MSKEIKKVKGKDALTYLNRLKWIGIFGILFSIALIIYDIVKYTNWMSIVSLIIDGLLLIFSVYFIIKSVKLTKLEKKATDKKKTK